MSNQHTVAWLRAYIQLRKRDLYYANGFDRAVILDDLLCCAIEYAYLAALNA